MDLSHILGNERIKAYLNRMVEQERVGHSLLFAGPDGIGKSLFADALAEHLLLDGSKAASQRDKLRRRSHPDLHHYYPQGKVAMHSIDAMRQFSEEVVLPPNEAPCKIFVIHDADRMLTTSANALLKTFEEPSAHTVIVLLSSAPQLLLPTVLSRCRTLHFQPLSEQEVMEGLARIHPELSEQEAGQFGLQAGGSLGRALRLYQAGNDGYRSILLQLLRQATRMNYVEAAEIIQQLSDALTTLKQEIEEQHREGLTPRGAEELTAVQKAEIQKEIDGAATLRFRNEVEGVLMECYAWYRDMHVIHEGGTSLCLHHRDQEAALQAAVLSGQMKSLELVSDIVKQASTSLARSTPIRDVLEGFFLKLELF